MSYNNYECLCGEFALCIDVNLPQLPRRKTDSAYIIMKQERNFVLAPSLKSSLKVVKRTQGYEKQYRAHCGSCGLWIAYHQEGKFLYVVESSVKDQIKQV